MRILLSRLIIVLAFLCSFSFAIDPLDLTLAVPAVAIIVGLFLAIGSMVATSTANPILSAWVKTEIRELFAGAALVVIVTILLASAGGLSIAISGNVDYIAAAQLVSQKWVGIYDDAFTYIVRAGSKIRAAVTYAPYINVDIWFVSLNYSSNPLAGLAVLLGSLTVASQALTNGIFLYETLGILLAFFKATLPKVLLPLAFCFRLVPFTRKIGNTLIAVCIGIMIFLPFSVLLADKLNQTITIPNPKIQNIRALDANPAAMIAAEPLCEQLPIRVLLSLTDELFATIVCAPLLLFPATAAFYETCRQLVTKVVYPLIMYIVQGVQATLLISWEVAFSSGGADRYATDIFNQLYPFLKDVTNSVFLGYLDFILILLITVAAIRSLSSALGGDYYMAGLQRLI